MAAFNGFNGLEQILMAVIKATSHSNDLISDERRFDNAMRALFGEFYSLTYRKNPAQVSQREINTIVGLRNSGLSLQSAIRQVVSKRFKKPLNEADKRSYEGELTPIIDRIRKHIERNESHYEQFITSDSDDDLLKSPYHEEEEKSEYIEKRKSIFKALRDADWPI
jgi:hypothetical protein